MLCLHILFVLQGRKVAVFVKLLLDNQLTAFWI
jgi:hypothetical protein